MKLILLTILLSVAPRILTAEDLSTCPLPVVDDTERFAVSDASTDAEEIPEPPLNPVITE